MYKGETDVSFPFWPCLCHVILALLHETATLQRGSDNPPFTIPAVVCMHHEQFLGGLRHLQGSGEAVTLLLPYSPLCFHHNFPSCLSLRTGHPHTTTKSVGRNSSRGTFQKDDGTGRKQFKSVKKHQPTWCVQQRARAHPWESGHMLLSCD